MKPRNLIWICLLLGSACTCLPLTSVARPAAHQAARPARTHPALTFFEGPHHAWPLVEPGIESRYFSSFDRTGGNADGFNGVFSVLYNLDNGEHVIFDALGPGVLNTLWFTGPEEGGRGLDLGTLKFYFDDEARPRIQTTASRLFGGKQAPFLAPLVSDNLQSSGGFVSWTPLPYEGRLIITTQKRPRFYIAQYDTHPAGAEMPSWTPALSYDRARAAFSAAARTAEHRGLRQVPLHHRHQGAGTIDLIQFRPAAAVTADQLSRARIRIFWDHEEQPGVDLPLGMFFGSGLGEVCVRSLAFSMEHGRYENRLPMPFWRGFELRVEGIEGELKIALGAARFARGRAGTLRARYRTALPTRPDHDFEWLSFKGAGKLVGTVLAIVPPHPEVKKWWEGDLRSYADGRRTPSMHGTGLEDDHLGGWSNTFFTNTFSLPMHGEPGARVIEYEGEQYNAQVTLYRLWPGIRFMGSIRHSLEHGSRNGVQALYAGAAFFYALPGGPRLRQVDHLDLGDQSSRRSHGFSVKGAEPLRRLESAFEGREDETMETHHVLSHRGAARFMVTITPRNAGCVLRRLFDQHTPRQRARVRVDGAHLTDWYTAERNSELRWAERDLFLPPRVTAGKRELTLSIEPDPSAPPWNAAEYRVLCVAPLP